MTDIKYILPNDSKELSRMVTGAIHSARQARQAVQVAAVGILYHAYKHGDYSEANTLILGLADKGIRRDSLVLWFQGFGGLILTDDKELIKTKPFTGWSGAEHIKTHFEEAKATMWDTVVKEKDPFVTMDLQTALMQVIKRFEKAAKASQKENFQGKISFELTGDVLAKLQALSQRPNVDTTDVAVIDKLEKLLAGNVDNTDNTGEVTNVA